jgi:hypothetical protein
MIKKQLKWLKNIFCVLDFSGLLNLIYLDKFNKSCHMLILKIYIQKVDETYPNVTYILF